MKALMALSWLLACLVLGRLASSAWACATVYPENRPVRFADQSVIICWDAANKVEHFIRQAAFDANTNDFGFIVPTPTKPTLAESKASAFDTLEKITARKTEWDWSVSPLMCAFLPSFKMSARLNGDSAGSSVRVLDMQRVAGFDAAVLEADDAAVLADWLKVRGYSFRPELIAWLDYYVAKKWKLTAFKIAHDTQTGKAATTAAVGRSFPTDRPFFPYRVPGESDPQRRLLRIFMVSGERVGGTLGDKGRWSGNAVWADRLTPQQATQLADRLGVDKTVMPPDAWLTTFDDPTFPNPGSDDVYFRPDASEWPLHRPPLQRTVWVPADVVVFVVGLVVYWRMSGRKPKSTPVAA